MSKLTKKHLRSDLFHEIRKKQPYEICLMEIPLLVQKDVFPPDIGSTTTYLARIISTYKNIQTALDMGCGSGFLALFMKKHGIETVWATDIHSPTISCTLNNIKLNKELNPIHVIQSDLFSQIPNHIRFDLIVFNYPYYPTIGDPVFGYNPDGGKEILIRFFQTLSNWCHINSIIILPFSSISDSEHDPAEIVKQFQHLEIYSLFDTQDEHGHHKIYEITFRKKIPTC